ncbi:MAG: hypothetical protein AAGJ97_14285, partial [Planctomycetota bacterium]
LELLIGGAVTAATTLLTLYRARRAWRRREFYDRINFSLTFVDDGVLKIRTLAEDEVGRVFLTKPAADRVVKSATRTTPDDPTLPLPDDEYWYFLNPVLNELSERYSAGLFRKLAGHPTTTVRYAVALTCEADGAIRTRKVRAMVVPTDLLAALGSDEPPAEPTYESPHHRRRWVTLGQLAVLRKTKPGRFIEVEITS